VSPRKGISLVWIFPIVALLVGVWIAYQALSEKGHNVTVNFRSAEGIEPGKTQVKFKSIVVGTVDDMEVTADLNELTLQITMEPSTGQYLTDQAKFWVVRPRIGPGGVSGLETLLAGPYIEFEPGRGGARQRRFQGLEEPPPVRFGQQGRRFKLLAPSLGAVSLGAPVYFRDFEVGEVVAYELNDAEGEFQVDIFVRAPHHNLVMANSRFWNVSGVSAEVGDRGLKVAVTSMESLLRGGVAFDQPAPRSEPAVEGQEFRLYSSRAAVDEREYTRRMEYIAYFHDSVRGLSPGASVEFRGIRVGTVKDLRLRWDSETEEFQIPVVLEIEPERFVAEDKVLNYLEQEAALGGLVDDGLVAQLRTGSLLTGQLYVDLQFLQDAPMRFVKDEGKYRQISTIPSPASEALTAFGRFTDVLQSLPLDRISTALVDTLEGTSKLVNSPDAGRVLTEAAAAMTAVRLTAASIEQRTDPMLAQLTQAAATAEQAMARAEQAMASFEPGSPVQRDLARTLQEASAAARSIRAFADYLQRNPDALISGKGGPRR
jgi:paraquat-inducible protein B